MGIHPGIPVKTQRHTIFTYCSCGYDSDEDDHGQWCRVEDVANLETRITVLEGLLREARPGDGCRGRFSVDIRERIDEALRG